jgi:hypothetical protein
MDSTINLFTFYLYKHFSGMVLSICHLGDFPETSRFHVTPGLPGRGSILSYDMWLCELHKRSDYPLVSMPGMAYTTRLFESKRMKLQILLKSGQSTAGILRSPSYQLLTVRAKVTSLL